MIVITAQIAIISGNSFVNLQGEHLKKQRSIFHCRREMSNPNESGMKPVFTKESFHLTAKRDYKLWASKIRLELKRNDSSFIVDDETEMPNQFQRCFKQQLERLKATIISLLDEKHHKYVVNLQEPKEILRTLDQRGNPKNHLAYHKTRTSRFYNLQFNKDDDLMS